MSDVVTIRDVILTGDDLNWPVSPWRSVNGANNQRLIPIALGFLGSAFSLSFMIDPSALELIAICVPILIGSYLYIWMTNTRYLGAYRTAYSVTPIGSGACTFTFDGWGMRQTLPLGQSAFEWAAFVDVVEHKSGFRFWLTPFMAVTLPARYTDDDQTIALRNLVQSVREKGHLKGP